MEILPITRWGAEEAQHPQAEEAGRVHRNSSCRWISTEQTRTAAVYPNGLVVGSRMQEVEEGGEGEWRDRRVLQFIS
jgi:hypothetical protein